MQRKLPPIPRWLLVLGAAAVGSDFGYMIGSDHGLHPSEQSFVTPADEQIVNHALDLYGHGKLSRDDLRRSYDINVVHLPTMTCVGFNLLPGTMGGDETVCFDETDQRRVSWFSNGQ